MSSPSKIPFQILTPSKSNVEMKMIVSPDKKQEVDLYDQLCQPLVSHPMSPLISNLDNFEAPSWSDEPSSSQNISYPSEQDKQNKPPQSVEKPIFQTVKKSERKGCHCQKSHCLKKYCDCFKLGLVCNENCLCVGCKNTQLTDNHLKYQKMVELTRSGKGGREQRCNCQKSRCMKNYCECHSNNRYCNPSCQCIDCDNRNSQDSELFGSKRKNLIEISPWNSGNILFN